MKLYCVCIAMLVNALIAPVACAATYKWVDGAGVTHYGEKPPPGVKAQELNIRAAPAPGASGKGPESPGGRTAQDLEREFQQRRVERLERESKEAEENARTGAEARKKCAYARYRYDLLNSGRPVYRLDQKGERVFMEDKTRETEIERMKKMIASTC